MEHIGDLFGNLHVSLEHKTRKTERGELLLYFSQKTGKPIPYIAMRLEKVPTPDLYFIQKSCDTYASTGKGAWGKAFFGSLKPR